jgi:hypothetical protein
VAALARRHYQQPVPLQGPRALAFTLVRVAALLSLLAVVLWTQVIALVEGTSSDPAGALRAAQWLSLLAFGGGLLAAVWNAVLAVRAQGWRGLFEVLLALAFAALVWLGLAYHLIGFSSEY